MKRKQEYERDTIILFYLFYRSNFNCLLFNKISFNRYSYISIFIFVSISRIDFLKIFYNQSIDKYR